MNAQDLNRLAQRLPLVLRRDRHGFKRRLDSLRKRLQAGKPISRDLDKLAQDLETSVAKCKQRAERLPVPTFPDDLPVSARREEIAEAIRKHQVIIVAGETGSGKTTQLPKICLLAGRGITGFIGCTQPRRIAARTIAGRIASELQGEVGQAVGYKVRFTDRLSEDSYIKLMTDGILLAETQGDRYLEQYDTLIIDEAHERSLNIDFLLGYLKQLLPRRRDLKLIVTSATIDTARFSAHFWNAPVMQIEGRTYPVEVRYRALVFPRPEPVEGGGKTRPGSAKTFASTGSANGLASASSREEKDLQQAILDATDEIARDVGGDILIFLPGEREIRETAEALRKHHPQNTEILPLYARLSAIEQNRVFQPGSQRRIVLTTNVAETSLTVPRIRAVIDPGLARISRYSTRSKVQRLPIENISRASADQRKGRCGRVGPGLCIRLYAEEDYLSRAEFTEPEILRTSLAAVILRMLHLNLGGPSTGSGTGIEDFPFVEPPDSRQISDGFKLLEELGAVDKSRQLTEIGRQLALLPIDPRIARMILAAKEYQCLHEVLIIAAALSVQDPRERPQEAQQQADQAHTGFSDERSDFLSFLKLWDFYQEQAKHLSKNKLRKLCQEKFLSYTRMLEWLDIHQQLSALAREQGWRFNEIPAEYEAVHRALLAGLLGNIATRALPRDNIPSRDVIPSEYQGARGIKLHIFPGSSQFKRKPKWLIAAELVETSRLYARCVARVEPEWIEQAAGLLCRRSYSEPHWEKRGGPSTGSVPSTGSGSGQVAAFEQVTVYGLVVVARRKINYGPIDPLVSRQIFIRSALVEGDYETDAEFFRHNRKLIEQVEELEHKARRQDILVDEQTLYEFYEARVPEGIYSGAQFESWRKQAEQETPKILFLTREEIMRQRGEGITHQAFPDFFQIQGARLKLEYHFEPGHEADGVTLNVPVQMLNQLTPARCEWLVPGLLHEKIVALMRGLPKHIRKQFVPLPDFAQAALEALEPGDIPLGEALGHYLHRISGASVPPESWEMDKLPAHLRMNFRLQDERGQVLAMGRDLAALQAQWREQAQARFAELPKRGLEREHLTDWDFGELPGEVKVKLKGLSLPGYPALVDCGTDAALRVFSDPREAQREHRAGLRRLFALQAAVTLKQLRRQASLSKALILHYAALGKPEDLKEDLAERLIDEIFLALPWPTDRAGFAQRLEQGRAALFPQAAERLALLEGIMRDYHALKRDFPLLADFEPEQVKKLEDLSKLQTLAVPHRQAIEDIRQHLQHLIYPDFVRHTQFAWLAHFPRYLKAIRVRLERLKQAPGRDAQKAAELAPLWQAYWQRKQATQPPESLEDFRWLLEELRVSLFAQELKTAMPVSVARAEKAWRELAGPG